MPLRKQMQKILLVRLSVQQINTAFVSVYFFVTLSQFDDL